MGFRGHGPRFDDFHALTARRASTEVETKCGHAIRIGERIGYSRRWKQTYCAGCWARWAAENADAQAYEDSLPQGFSDEGGY